MSDEIRNLERELSNLSSEAGRYRDKADSVENTLRDVQATHKADIGALSKQINSLGVLIEVVHNQLESTVNSVGDTVNRNIITTHDNLTEIISNFHIEFNEYVKMQMMANRFQIAETRLVKIRQEIEKKFGHYDVVRRTITGILQADDLSIVKSSTITNVTEELMITTPNYWLAPCLVALAAWINDQKEVAERARDESLKRDKKKTSLLFGLICRRANRQATTLRWIRKYMDEQNEDKLDRETIIILDAYTSGLFGNDSEGLVSDKVIEWLENLKEKPNFVNEQTKQWCDAINSMRRYIPSDKYPYIRKYSHTSEAIIEALEEVNINPTLYSYFDKIFSANDSSSDDLKVQLDEILSGLVTDFDEEEIPLRKSEQYEQLVVDAKGDEEDANKKMQLENIAFETQKNFTQLLTDSAMHPELSHAKKSTQKFAISLSKEWIMEAYNRILENYRAGIPKDIEINFDTFNGKTTDGRNEDELIHQFNELIKKERYEEWLNIRMSKFSQFCLIGGIATIIIGIVIAFVPSFSGIMPIGIIAAIGGIGMVINYLVKCSVEKKGKAKLNAKYSEKKKKGIDILRATIAEIVDFRQEFKQNDGRSEDVMNFLKQIAPDKYIKQVTNPKSKIFEKVEV